MKAQSLGTLRYFQQLGQSYTDMLRGTLTVSGFVTAGAAWLGMGKVGAVLLGVASLILWQVLAVGFGWLVWRWRVVHQTLALDRDNNPATAEMLALLRQIAANTGHTNGLNVRVAVPR